MASARMLVQSMRLEASSTSASLISLTKASATRPAAASQGNAVLFGVRGELSAFLTGRVRVGNADQSGDANYNVKLSKQRADTVASVLSGRDIKIAGVFARGDQRAHNGDRDRRAHREQAACVA